MGSVTPLLAVAEEIKSKTSEVEFLWLGTKSGPEKKLVCAQGIIFKELPAGKLRRYFSGWNFLMPFFIIGGFIKAFWLILRFRPQIILSAGGFVGVPVIWAGWFLRVPSLVHQQDIRPGLANKLTAPFAKIVTVTFSESLKYFPEAILTGNPVRRDVFSGDKERALKFFSLEKDLPTLLVLGGGTGALKLNEIVSGALSELVKFCQVIHVTGGRLAKETPEGGTGRYHVFDFLAEQLKDAYVAADLVVSRAGLGTLTELAALGKPTVLVPILKSHQEDNAWYFKKNNAVEILDQAQLSSANFADSIQGLINNQVELESLSRNIRKVMKLGAAGVMVEEIFKIIKK